ncbi:MAG: DNA mismatch repair protein MutS [Deltaproteobacteria bacterium]|nr:DNA mismatch repair protein MutS [Deltaproteobacteria bacterium]
MAGAAKRSEPGPQVGSWRDLLDGRRLTPMFRQYLELKATVPDAVMLIRMGDFYEVFFEDAKLCARALDLTLTARDKLGTNPIPMAGVPHHALGGYKKKLIELGHKVAIAEQVEDPKLAKGLVKRAIIEVVTPGTIMEPEHLDARAANYLVALAPDGNGRVGLACIDISTGEFSCTELDEGAQLSAELVRLDPRELLVPEEEESEPWVRDLPPSDGRRLSVVSASAYLLDAARDDLSTLLGVRDLSGFGIVEQVLPVQAAGAILVYLRSNHVSTLGHVRRLRLYELSQFMVLDEATRRNLELFRTMQAGKRKGSLLGLMDRTVTGMGSRRLRRWLGAPLLEPGAIQARHDAVELLVTSRELRGHLRDRLDRVYDIERLNAKVQTGRATPKDLVALRRSLEQAPAIDLLLDRTDTRALPLFAPLPDTTQLCRTIEEALVDEPPTSTKDGGVIRAGYHEELDELVGLSREGKGALARLESEERARTGIGSLKVRYNRVFGYFIEVTKANLGSVPDHYVRKQTLANAERYFTPELKEYENKVLGAEERRIALEAELFAAMREHVASHAGPLGELADRIGAIDVLVALAELAVANDYVRPVMDDSTQLHIEGGRHPVIERMDLGERFVPNDVVLEPDGERLLIISGPNMAGKSTVMRQVALIALMAQAGSFVPARNATIGVVDRIFTRVGASDDIARGQSTFMVEMSETAAILHHATDRSLAILDEIGRGTSTYDGLAIAWAVAEHLADVVQCRALFATHYHELAELSGTRPHVANYNIAVSEMGDTVIFLRRLRRGGASRSYGIQVAKLAGLPEAVLARAREVLGNLELASRDEVGSPKLARSRAKPPPSTGQLGLFVDRSSVLKDELLKINIGNLTPLEALNLLAELKTKAEGL